MDITLTPDLERALAEEARKQGTTPEMLVLEGLRRLFLGTRKPAGAEPRSLAELLEGYVGVLHSGEKVPGGAAMSEACGEKFTAALLAKHRQPRG
jgi:hypothetical protein